MLNCSVRRTALVNREVGSTEIFVSVCDISWVYINIQHPTDPSVHTPVHNISQLCVIFFIGALCFRTCFNCSWHYKWQFGTGICVASEDRKILPTVHFVLVNPTLHLKTKMLHFFGWSLVQILDVTDSISAVCVHHMWCCL